MTDDPRTAKKHHLRVLEPVREYKAQLAKSRTVDTSALVGNPEDGVIRTDSPSGPVTLTDPDQLAWIQHCKRAAVDFIYFANFMCGVRVHPGQIKVAQEMDDKGLRRTCCCERLGQDFRVCSARALGVLW